VRRSFRLAPLLFLSGTCSLLYQAAWMRDFRLVFGASTLASAAVTAIFMGGLGVGSWWGGRRVDRSAAPLMFYGNLELVAAGSAAITPLLLAAVRAIYLGVGGSLVLGDGGASILRLLLSAVVLAIPTLAMGATLPAVVAAAVNADGEDRRPVGWLYGANTLGAVFGTLLGTFVLIEVFGVHRTLWLGAGVNALLGLVARAMARAWPGEERIPTPGPVQSSAAMLGGQRVLVLAAAMVGLVFFLMEMVWYRLLSPILGGSTFTFGLVLALALFGIAVGGALHSLLGSARSSRSTLALTCLLEALFLALPFAFADDLAVLAALLRSLATMGLPGLALGWSIVAGILILPPAIVAGYQFPLLISLLRPKAAGIGSAVAIGYAANTAGSIAGALLGGFGLLHLLTAPGAWRLCVAILGCLALALLVLPGEVRGRGRWPGLVAAGGLAAVLAVLMGSAGPTAVWRHSAIGAGRANLASMGPNELEHWKRVQESSLLWETDGVESSVALVKQDDLSFMVNGKSDGATISDSGTQIMLGMVGAISHPAPRRALVVGLGTGSTAGWLAAIPEMERVDVVEIEPAIVEVARRASLANRDVLSNPKVRLIFADAREVLLASSEKYDLIASEPSNPYRIGVASLFSQEFYRAVKARLNPGGLFLQWIQGYEVFPHTLRTAMATLGSVFPDVETWETQRWDMVLVASEEPHVYDIARLRSRAEAEPFRSALTHAWSVEGAEGYLANFIAGSALVRSVSTEEGEEVNTDDRPVLEYGFARSVGHKNPMMVPALRAAARTLHADRPRVSGEVDWERVDQIRMALSEYRGVGWSVPDGASERTKQLGRALAASHDGRVLDARKEIEPLLDALQTPTELRIAAEILARTHSPAFDKVNERLRVYRPLFSRTLVARNTFAAGDVAGASSALEEILLATRTADPWEVYEAFNYAASLAEEIARKEPARAERFLRAVAQPFPLYRGESLRRRVVSELAELVSSGCAQAIGALEPFPDWEKSTLLRRVRCYEREKSPLLARAKEDLLEFMAQEDSGFQLRQATAGAAENLSADAKAP
jgi:spermidine synthase